MKQITCVLALIVLCVQPAIASDCSEIKNSDVIYRNRTAVCELFPEQVTSEAIIPEKLLCVSTVEAEICDAEAFKPCNFQYEYTKYSNLAVDGCWTVHEGKRVECGKPLITKKSSEGGWGDKKEMSLTLPTCSEGDVFTLKFNRTYTSYVRGDFAYTYSFGGFNFEKYSRFEFVVPEGTNLYYDSTGDTEPQIISKDGKKHYLWLKHDTAPIDNEENIPSTYSILDVIRISSAANYGNIYSTAKYIFKNINNDTPIPEKADEITAGRQDEDAAKTIYDWVRENIRYVADDLVLDPGLAPTPQQVLNRTYGDCEDFSILLVSLLKAKGYNAELVLYGSDYDFPQTTMFDHVITRLFLGNKTIWMDPTCRSCPYGTIPYSEYNKYVLPMSDKKIEKTPYYNTVDYRKSTRIHYVIRGTVVSVNYSSEIQDLLSAEELRLHLKSLNDKELKKYFEDLASSVCTDYSDLKYSLDDNGSSIKLNMNHTCMGLVRTDKDSMATSLPRSINLPSYLNSDNRNQDFDFGASTLTEKIQIIEFPSDYAVRTQLNDIKIGTHHQSYTLNYSVSGNTAVIQERRYIYRQVPKEEFQDMKNTYLSYNRIIEPILGEKEVATTTTSSISTSSTQTIGSEQKVAGADGVVPIIFVSFVVLLLVTLILFKGRIIKI